MRIFIHHKIGVFGDTEKHFFGASLVGAPFYFKENVMKFQKILVCLLAVLILSSCVNYVYGTDFPSDTPEESTTEPITEGVENVRETIPSETEYAQEETEKSFIVNKSTKKFHNEDCRYVGFMNEENKLFITSTSEKLQSLSYSPCAFCQE